MSVGLQHCVGLFALGFSRGTGLDRKTWDYFILQAKGLWEIWREEQGLI